MVIVTNGIRPICEITRLIFCIYELGDLPSSAVWKEHCLIIALRTPPHIAGLRSVVTHRLTVIDRCILPGSLRLYLAHTDWAWGSPELHSHSDLKILVFLTDGLLCPLSFLLLNFNLRI